MKLDLKGWNEQVGAYHCDVTIDERKNDHVIYFTDGIISRQQTPFQALALDWDQDGNQYSKVGAFFDYRGQLEFFTPKELASLALTCRARIPGLKIEDKQPNLADRIQAASRRAKALADNQVRTKQQTRNAAEPVL